MNIDVQSSWWAHHLDRSSARSVFVAGAVTFGLWTCGSFSEIEGCLERKLHIGILEALLLLKALAGLRDVILMCRFRGTHITLWTWHFVDLEGSADSVANAANVLSYVCSRVRALLHVLS